MPKIVMGSSYDRSKEPRPPGQTVGRQRQPGYVEPTEAAEDPKRFRKPRKSHSRGPSLKQPVEIEQPPEEYEVLPPPRRAGNKPGQPTGQGFIATEQQRRLVAEMSEYGVPLKAICAHVINEMTGHGISINTLKEHFPAELEVGEAKANAKLARCAYLQAVGAPAEYDEEGNCIRVERLPVPAMTKFQMSVRMGWKDGGGPGFDNMPDKVGQQILKDLEQLTYEEIRQIRDLSRKRADAQPARIAAGGRQAAMRKQSA